MRDDDIAIREFRVWDDGCLAVEERSDKPSPLRSFRVDRLLVVGFECDATSDRDCFDNDYNAVIDVMQTNVFSEIAFDLMGAASVPVGLPRAIRALNRLGFEITIYNASPAACTCLERHHIDEYVHIRPLSVMQQNGLCRGSHRQPCCRERT